MKCIVQRRMITWLCLVLTLLTGLTPAQGFVVCIEADGCVSVEIKAPTSDCDGCEGHDEIATQQPASSDAADGCPCIDLAVPGTSELLRAPTRFCDLSSGLWIAPTTSVLVEQLSRLAIDVRGPPAEVPRPADSLAHLRSVVLLV